MAIFAGSKDETWNSRLGLNLSDKSTDNEFWQWLINRYLKPLEKNEKAEKNVQEELIQLRNKVCLFFLLVNALFVTVVFSLQQVNSQDETLSIRLPCAEEEYGESIEPISIAFTVVFGLLLLLQFVCMCIHRISTFLHICSTVEMNMFSLKKEDLKDERTRIKVSPSQMVDLIKQIQVPFYMDTAQSKEMVDIGKIYKNLKDVFTDNFKEMEKENQEKEEPEIEARTDASKQVQSSPCRKLLEQVNHNRSLRDAFQETIRQKHLQNQPNQFKSGHVVVRSAIRNTYAAAQASTSESSSSEQKTRLERANSVNPIGEEHSTSDKHPIIYWEINDDKL